MKKLGLCAVLLLAAPLAQADWVKVFENIRGTTVYVDPDSVVASGRYRKVMELQSYREPGPRGVLSMKIRKEYDCQAGAARMLSYVVYAGKMGSGEKIGTVETPGEWQEVSKNPGGKGGFRLVCEP